MTPRDALAKIQFQLVEVHGNISGMAAPIDQQADRMLVELRDAGFVLVPMEPTEKMWREGNVTMIESIDAYSSDDKEASSDIYRAMIRAVDN